MIRYPLHELLDLSDSGVWGDEDAANGVSILRSTNFNADGRLDFSNLSFRTIEAKKRDSKLLLDGDILLEKSGGGPKQPVGRVCLFRGHDLPHSFGNFIARLRPKKALVLSEYLFFFLWHFHSIGKTSHYQKQTTGIRNLEYKRYLSIEVPVPTLAEQQRIVDILSRAGSIVRLRREAQQKAAELVPAIFLDMFGDPATNPKGWPELGFEDYLSIQSSVQTPDLVADAELPCIGADSIESGTGRIVSWPTVEDVKPISGKYSFTRNDVLYSKIRPALRKAIVAPDSGYCSADMYPLRPKNGVATPEYVAALLLSKAFTDYAIGVSARAQMPKVNRESLFAYRHPMPPFRFQEVFASRVKEVNSILGGLDSSLAKSEQVLNTLLGRLFRRD